jgi:hypothetical protein
MDVQLHLLPDDDTGPPATSGDSAWRLDRRTVETGQQGIALARAALRAARHHRSDATSTAVDRSRDAA